MPAHGLFDVQEFIAAENHLAEAAERITGGIRGSRILLLQPRRASGKKLRRLLQLFGGWRPAELDEQLVGQVAQPEVGLVHSAMLRRPRGSLCCRATPFL